MTAIMVATDRMEQTLDARGLACPLIVLATDAEAPIDVAAVAADAGCAFAAEERDGAWRLTLRRPPAPSRG
jgi:TusA-related sulfurtransferase